MLFVDTPSTLLIAVLHWLSVNHGSIAFWKHHHSHYQYPACFAYRYMILSCVMILHSVLSFILRCKYMYWLHDVLHRQEAFTLPEHRKPPDIMPTSHLRRRDKPTTFKGVTRLALLVAISKAA